MVALRFITHLETIIIFKVQISKTLIKTTIITVSTRDKGVYTAVAAVVVKARVA